MPIFYSRVYRKLVKVTVAGQSTFFYLKLFEIMVIIGDRPPGWFPPIVFISIF